MSERPNTGGSDGTGRLGMTGGSGVGDGPRSGGVVGLKRAGPASRTGGTGDCAVSGR